MDVNLSPRVTDSRAVQPLKAFMPIETTLFGTTMDVNDLQPSNIEFPIEISVSGKTTEVSDKQPLNMPLLKETMVIPGNSLVKSNDLIVLSISVRLYTRLLLIRIYFIRLFSTISNEVTLKFSSRYELSKT